RIHQTHSSVTGIDASFQLARTAGSAEGNRYQHRTRENRNASDEKSSGYFDVHIHLLIQGLVSFGGSNLLPASGTVKRIAKAHEVGGGSQLPSASADQKALMERSPYHPYKRMGSTCNLANVLIHLLTQMV